jgi:Amt family ammonium transporter
MITLSHFGHFAGLKRLLSKANIFRSSGAVLTAFLLSLGLFAAPAAYAEDEEVTVESLLATGLITMAEIEAFLADEYSLEDIYGQVELKAEYLDLVASHGFHAYAFDFFVTSMLWTVIAAAMVFIMHLGFATLETGLTQQKNAVNVLFKNVWIISVGILTYAFIGFNTHYPGGPEDWNGFISFGGWIGDLSGDSTFGYGGVGLAMTAYGDFIFQAMFAATAATIVSGAVAERIKLPAFMIFALLLVAIAYPVAGSWHWGEGFLNRMDVEFYDFAGSSAVHAFGGFAALAAVIILGPRRGKYLEGGKIRPIPASNFPLATVGVFLLFFGWFGFNGGSVLSADPSYLGLVFTTTALSATAGAVGAIFLSWFVLKKPDLSMALNGILGGLVGITAGADAVGPLASVFIGFTSGLIVVAAILVLDKAKIDDPVGAIAVHGIAGIYGTVIIAFFNEDISFVSQLIGTVSFCAFAFLFALVVCLALKFTIGIRVSEEEEEMGLDIGEHGQEAYPNFQTRR